MANVEGSGRPVCGIRKVSTRRVVTYLQIGTTPRPSPWACSEIFAKKKDPRSALLGELCVPLVVVEALGGDLLCAFLVPFEFDFDRKQLVVCTYSPRPEADNPWPTTCSPQPMTRNVWLAHCDGPKPMARNLWPATCGLQPVAHNLLPAPCGPQPVAHNLW